MHNAVKIDFFYSFYCLRFATYLLFIEIEIDLLCNSWIIQWITIVEQLVARSF